MTTNVPDTAPPLRQLFAVLLVVLASGALAGWLWLTRERVTTALPEHVPPSVNVLTVALADVPVTIEAHGRLEPRGRFTPVCEVGARVVELGVPFEDGGRVARGDLLVRFDDVDVQLALADSRAQLLEAQAALAIEEAEAERALAEWRLVGEGEPSALARREPQLAAARARVASIEVRVRRAELDLERTVVRAPFDARVLSRDVELGERCIPGRVLGELADSAAFEVRLAVAASDLAFLPALAAGGADGDEALVRVFGSRGELAARARVVRHAARVEPRTQTLELIVSVEPTAAPTSDSDAAALVAGAYVDAHVAGRSIANAVALPRRALLESGGVLVIGADSRAFVRAVEVVRTAGATVVIGSGLSNGERVVLDPPTVVADGMEVHVLTGPEADAR